MNELEHLKKAMDAATPEPNAARRATNHMRALENFDRFQESRGGTRLTEQRAISARLSEGAKKMLNAISTRGGLAATTAITAVALLMLVPQGQDVFAPPALVDDLRGPKTESRTVAEPELSQRPSEASGDEAGEGLAKVIERDAAATSEFAAPLAEEAAPATLGARGDSVTGSSVVLNQTSPERQRIIAGADAVSPIQESDTEAFANAETNPLKITKEDPVSTFSIDVDTASYAVVRSSIMAGVMPPRDAVRVEEMVNYFPYDYPAPENGMPFRPTITVSPTPWNDGTQLVHVGLQGTMPAIEDRPPLNLVFLIDTSGSMQDANKLPLLKQSFRLMLSELRPEDEISIVTYAGSAGQVLEPTPASERSKIISALDRLQAGGSTAGQAGLQQAYAVAEAMTAKDEVTRVVLATDGDFNVGLSDPEALKDFIAEKRASGTYLSVLGFGRGNLDDATMQALAQNGNGQAAYIDTINEARKVLVDQLTGALFPIANDVKIQIEFNPAKVAEYRLIGYETRALNREDFNNDKVDAGEIGAGHSVTAIYEVTPVGSDAVRTGALRYAEEEPASTSDEIGYFKLRYKEPGETTSQLIERPITDAMGSVNDDVRFSIAMAGFGQLLRGGAYLGSWDYGDAIDLAAASRGEDPFGYRNEAVSLIRLAQALARN